MHRCEYNAVASTFWAEQAHRDQADLDASFDSCNTILLVHEISPAGFVSRIMMRYSPAEKSTYNPQNTK